MQENEPPSLSSSFPILFFYRQSHASNISTYSLVACRQPVCRFSRCSFVLAVVLNLWLDNVSAQAAYPVASAPDRTQHQVNNHSYKYSGHLNVLDTFQVTAREAYEGKLSRAGI